MIQPFPPGLDRGLWPLLHYHVLVGGGPSSSLSGSASFCLLLQVPVVGNFNLENNGKFVSVCLIENCMCY